MHMPLRLSLLSDLVSNTELYAAGPKHSSTRNSMYLVKSAEAKHGNVRVRVNYSLMIREVPVRQRDVASKV